jgi:hypothetical protein
VAGQIGGTVPEMTTVHTAEMTTGTTIAETDRAHRETGQNAQTVGTGNVITMRTVDDVTNPKTHIVRRTMAEIGQETGVVREIATPVEIVKVASHETGRTRSRQKVCPLPLTSHNP